MFHFKKNKKKIRSKGKDFSVSACQSTHPPLALSQEWKLSIAYPLPTNPTNPITHPSLDPINKQTNCKAWSEKEMQKLIK